MGFPMITPRTPTLPISASQPSLVCFRGGVFRRVGNLRSVTLHGRTSDDDRIFGLLKLRQDAVNEGVTLLAPVI
jgi:hypothetical protein